VHLLDVSGLAEVDPQKAYDQVLEELALFGGRLSKLPRVIAPSKIDMLPPQAVGKWKRKFKNSRHEVCPISAISRAGLDNLLKILEVLV
jgi:GTP-binding protein